MIQNHIHLFRSQQRADAFAKKLASDGNFLGHVCTTPQNFVRDIVKMCEPSINLADPSSRLAHLLSVVSSTDDLEAYEYYFKPQNLMFLMKFVELTLGIDEFMEASKTIGADESIYSCLEESTLAVANEYETVLAAFDLHELGVASKDVETIFENKFDVTYEDVCVSSQAIQNCIYRVSKDPSVITTTKPQPFKERIGDREISFATLSETRAKIPVFVDALKNLSERKSVAIVTNNLEEDAQAIEKLVVQMGIDAKIEYTQKKSFLDTNVGQAFYACDEALHSEEDAVETKFSDFAHNPLSGISLYKCLEIDKNLRMNPYVFRQRIASELKDISPTFDLFMTIADEPFVADNSQVLDAIESYIENGLSLTDSQKRENLVALTAFKSFFETLCRIGYDDDFDFSILGCLNIVSEFVVGNPKSQSKVTLLSPSTLNKVAEKQFDKVIFTDATSLTFNASTRFDALSTLLDKMEIEPSASASELARMNFQSGILASKEKVLFCLPSRDLRSNQELSPSFVLQELFLELFGDNLDFENLNEQCKANGIKHVTYGEDCIPLIGNCSLDSDLATRNVYPLNFELKTCAVIDKYLKKTDAGDVILSPSEIEVYCQCPQKWFYERRVSPQTLDYEFNQVEKGNIAHLAFKLFYDELYSQGTFRLNSFDDVSANRDLFASCYNKAVRETLVSQDLEGEDCTKVKDFLSAFEIMELLNDCSTSLSVQSLFPKKYVVAESEMKITPENSVNYAGVIINGVLDRLDVSRETDSFIVVDYKGSIRDHGCGKDALALMVDDAKDVPLPPKIQGLIYASCVQKMTNKKCDAAIYVSYNKLKLDLPPAIGAIDAEVIDGFYDVLGNLGESTVEIGMQTYLSLTEERVKSRIDDLLNSNVSPSPLNKKCCEFCTVLNCPARGRN